MSEDRALTISVVELPAEMRAAYRVRHEVFVEEQSVPIAEEIDAIDAQAVHLIAEVDGLIVGTVRLVPPAVPGGAVHLGRLAVLRDYRGMRIGAALVREVERQALRRYGLAGSVRVELSAQVSAEEFYRRLGYEVYGPVYLDAGIEHRDAVRVVRAAEAMS